LVLDEMKVSREKREEEAKADRELWAEESRANRLQMETTFKALLESQPKKEKSTIFTFRPVLVTPEIDDTDNDIEMHMLNFESYLAMVDPNGGMLSMDKLKLFGTTLKGHKRRCYDQEYSEANRSGTLRTEPETIFLAIVARLKADFHESDDSRSLKAMAKYDGLERGKDTFQSFSIAWGEALAGLKRAGISKPDRELHLGYIRKLGGELQRHVLSDMRFWPPGSGAQGEWRKAETWQEAAILAKEFVASKINAKIFVESTYAIQEEPETVLYQDSGKTGRGKKGKEGKATTQGGKTKAPEQIYVAEGMPSESKGCYICKCLGHMA
jgi:hypothetical protein